jgi:hypothetical protein
MSSIDKCMKAICGVTMLRLEIYIVLSSTTRANISLFSQRLVFNCLKHGILSFAILLTTLKYALLPHLAIALLPHLAIAVSKSIGLHMDDLFIT